MQGPRHNGGKMIIGPDKNLYLVIGDVRNHATQARNELTALLLMELGVYSE